MALVDENDPQNPGRRSFVSVNGTDVVSLQTYQGIYNQLTGKSESLVEQFLRPYQIDFENLDDLNHRIGQTLEQYDVEATNVSCTIYYVNDVKDELSSFSKLQFLRANNSNQVESVQVKYHFLIVLPKVRTPQTYTITVRLTSPLAIEKRLNSEPFGFVPSGVIRLMGLRSASCKIEYVDYTVARAFQTTIRDWFSTLKQAPARPTLASIQAHSHWIPRFTPLLIVLLASAFLFIQVRQSTDPAASDFKRIAEFVIASFALLYTSYFIGDWIGKFIERKIDSMSDLAYINFNKGDELEISRHKTRNRKSFMLVVSGVVSAFLYSVLTKLVAALVVTELMSRF